MNGFVNEVQAKNEAVRLKNDCFLNPSSNVFYISCVEWYTDSELLSWIFPFFDGLSLLADVFV